MTDTALSLNLTVYIITAMGTALLSALFTITAIAGTARTGGLNRLFYTFFAFFLTLYSLAVTLPAAGLLTIRGFSPAAQSLAASLLFLLTLLFYTLHYHFGLKARSHARTVIPAVILFVILTSLSALSLLYRGTGTVLGLLAKPDWETLAPASFGLFLLIRLIVAYCFHEPGKGGGTVSLLLFALPPFLPLISPGIFGNSPVRMCALLSLPLLIVWEFIRHFTAAQAKESAGKPQPLGELREQLSESRTKQKDLNGLLTDREEELGRIRGQARKVSRGLLPGVIHHDGLWEVTTFFNQSPRKEKKELFDFYYTYGRKVAGLSLFSTPKEPQGALYGSLLKKEWTESFNETSSLASLFRRIDAHLREIFPEEEALTGSVLKLKTDKVEYTGYANPAIYYLNGRLNKCAPLIQDRAEGIEDIKSYSLPCLPGDSFLIANDNFLNKPASVTGKTFSREKLPEKLENFKGKSADMVRELIDERNKFLGRKDEGDILVIHIKRKG